MKRPQWMAIFFALALLFCFAMPVAAFDSDIFLDSEFAGPYVGLTVSF